MIPQRIRWNSFYSASTLVYNIGIGLCYLLVGLTIRLPESAPSGRVLFAQAFSAKLSERPASAREFIARLEAALS